MWVGNPVRRSEKHLECPAGTDPQSASAPVDGVAAALDFAALDFAALDFAAVDFGTLAFADVGGPAVAGAAMPTATMPITTMPAAAVTAANRVCLTTLPRRALGGSSPAVEPARLVPDSTVDHEKAR